MEWGSEPELIGPRHLYRVGLVARVLTRHLPRAADPRGTATARRPRVLDAGAGRGTLAVELARRGYAVAAVEESERFVAYLRSRGAAEPGARLAVARGDVTALPFGSAAFDGIVCGEVLEHVDADAAAMAELARVLRPGGVLVATVPAGRGRYGWLDRWAGHARRYERDELDRLATRSGLRVERLHHWGFPFGAAYERLIQRPVLARHARAGAPPTLALRLGRARPVTRALGLLFALDRLCDRLPWGPSLLLVARKASARAPNALAAAAADPG